MHISNYISTLKTLFYSFCIFFLTTGCNSKQNVYKTLQGNVFGTTFHIKYAETIERNIEEDIAQLFEKINHSLSTYHKESVISQLNNQPLASVTIDEHFLKVMEVSKKVYLDTDGYFDPTIGKTASVWGFGAKKITQEPTQNEIDSLLQYVGFDKVHVENNVLLKENKEIYLNFNAVAKGYGVDAVGVLLEGLGIQDYMVEIGGEVRARGTNDKGQFWSIGIEEPNFDGTRSLQKVTRLQNEAIATSGNYRKFRVDPNTGKKIAHTLNPKTGSPSETDLLSVSVITNGSCAEADAYATGLMSMGYEKATSVVAKHPELKVFFIYLDNNEVKTYASKGLTFIK
ncbi:FAD:protein FMN transferase [Ochrovirga pacifica]|uniref:FAD:protein FMN transferase n=1 Tax=Ochrovirga pacifica TaxID=1042376 RepID=UPI00031DDA88|nr:FAD:protein FMN transferase [Ochrovirga pacifica]